MLLARLSRRALSTAVPAPAARALATASRWADMQPAPPDPIVGLTEAFNADDDPRKVSVGVGAYRSDEGKPVVLNSIRKAERMLLEQDLNHEYLPIHGLQSYIDRSMEFAYGAGSSALGRLSAVQALSGTGALRVGFEFINRFVGEGTPIYMPAPTWANHIPTAADAGLEVRTYRYYDKDTIGLDFAGLMQDVRDAPDGSFFLLHACAHNPTGVDPSNDQWRELSAAFADKGHFAFFDSAYQGFASGCPDADAFAVRQFVDDGHCIALCQSFAKNFGLYGERVGTFSLVCTDAHEAQTVQSQLKALVRPMYSSPPVYGARIVDAVLGDDALRAEWYGECKAMADRIIAMRALLTEELARAGSDRDWSHINGQIGMFCFSGLTPDEVRRMIDVHHVYMTGNGRISMAGVTSGNARYLAEAMHEVTTAGL
jgi:aspartate aminotransferase